jgi:predicted molibdopterin-dependent oxidoreductase YjgC
MSFQNIVAINGQEYPFTKGETILEVALRNGVEIPTLCYLRGASPTGRCDICLVEIEGQNELVQSCQTIAESSMFVRTETPRLAEARRIKLEQLLTSGQHNCFVQEMDLDSWTDFQLDAMDADTHHGLCPAYGDCRLQDLAVRYRARPTGPATVSPYLVEDVNPFIVRDFSRCILCSRCVQACNEVQVNNVIHLGYEGPKSKIITKGDLPLKDSDCVFCGECVQVCPVGALFSKRDLELQISANETKKISTTCSYCGVGCQIYIHVKDDQIVKVSGAEENGPNKGSLCVKGRFGFDFVQHPDRLKLPLVRKDGELKEASWDEAIELVAKKLSSIKQEFGPDSIGVLTSARVTNEENYLAQKFARAVLGTNNIDHCARL